MSVTELKESVQAIKKMKEIGDKENVQPRNENCVEKEDTV